MAQNRRNQNFINTRGSSVSLNNELGWAYEAANGTALDRLARHETRLERSAMRCLQALEQLRSSEVPLAADAPVQLGLFDEADEKSKVAPDDGTTSTASVSELAYLPRVPGQTK